MDPTKRIAADLPAEKELLIALDSEGFVIAEPASSRQFLPKHYLNPLPLQQIQLSQGTLQQNEGW